MARQIKTTRAVVARLHGSLGTSSVAQVRNVEIVQVEALARVAYHVITDPEGERFRPVHEQAGLTRENVTALWHSVSEVMRLYRKYGPYGDPGPN
ncbi:hypothetical protein DAETH_47940 (plasmid) [Deinococcus aetherius]|uniref:Uncharacterized protein n=1 Tax=Deinococcus aetherius TaxID=200252 RepID=A0ABN6RNE5_9DEIO|nr:hypothetical protein [Deinococcus aetherius]BDP44825.1 hypothetical protein DAETH_47940 [Deinococcus aetherius]